MLDFYGMHPVVYLLDNIYLSIGQSTQQLLQQNKIITTVPTFVFYMRVLLYSSVYFVLL
jgi:hypothetical protein